MGRCIIQAVSASFLQVLQFTQQEYMQLAHKALPLWISLLSSAERAQRGSREDVPLPLDCMVPLMDLAGKCTMSRGNSLWSIIGADLDSRSETGTTCQQFVSPRMSRSNLGASNQAEEWPEKGCFAWTSCDCPCC